MNPDLTNPRADEIDAILKRAEQGAFAADVVAMLADAMRRAGRFDEAQRLALRARPRQVARQVEDAHARVVGACLTQVDAKVHGRSGYADAEVYHPRYGGYFRE